MDSILRLAHVLKRGDLLIQQATKQIGINGADMEYAGDSFAKGQLDLAGASEPRLPFGDCFHVL